MTTRLRAAKLVDVRYTKLRHSLWWKSGANTNRSHHADQPLPPDRPSRDAIIAAHVLRIVAGYRVPDLRVMRRALRACADSLDPRPGCLDFPREQTSEPTQEGAAS